MIGFLSSSYCFYIGLSDLENDILVWSGYYDDAQFLLKRTIYFEKGI